MCLHRYLSVNAQDIGYEIVGTDVDPKCIGWAQNGVYRRDEIKEIPMSYLDDHWAKGTGDISHYVKVKKSLRAHCRFHVENLLELSQTRDCSRFDVIFCRNVFIYFSPEQVRTITKSLLDRLSPSGFLFIGVSESLRGLELPVKSLGPSIYTNALESFSAPREHAHLVASTQASPAPTIVRVVCVDDSPSILALLKKVLTKDHGFEVVGTATHGIEAQACIRDLKPDVVTLDIHMPEQDGHLGFAG